MKRLFVLAVAAALAVPGIAEEPEKAESAKAPQTQEERKRESLAWPAYFAVSEFPASPDVIGLRLTIPFSSKQENVSGLDLGLWGRSLYFQGLQLNLLRNDVKDEMSGIQVGVYNSIGFGQMLGVQVGLFNEANALRGLQAGLVNLGGEMQGFQVGLVNRSETMFGYQVGLVNIIRDAELQFCPLINIGF